ncbi:MAG: HNH endonuclease signature motif containing protein, partial [Candidatus Cloacimonadaceae bacterium]|nr:HNH endonuclease signature motif containing protein [Candidatus Cloacimonadaceae bacterium]
NGWQYEHRYIVEKHNKIKLDTNQEVHHINGDKKDNRIENLKVLTQSEHYEIHHSSSSFNYLPLVLQSYKLKMGQEFIEKLMSAIPDNPTMTEIASILLYCKISEKVCGDYPYFDEAIFKQMTESISDTIEKIGLLVSYENATFDPIRVASIVQFLEPIYLCVLSHYPRI